MASGANRIPLGKLILGPSANGESGPSRASLLTTKSSSSMLKPEYVVGEPSSSPGHAPVHGPVRPTTSRFSSAPPPPPPDPVPVPASFPIKQEKPTVEKDRGSRDRSRERDRDRDRDRGKRRDRDSERGARDFDEDRGRRDRDRDGYRERERGGGGGGGDRHFWREKSRDSVSSRDYREKDRDREREHRGRDRNSRSRYDDNGYDEERERPPPAPRQDLSNSIISAEDADPTRKRKKSRWAETTEARAFIPGMPTIIPANLSREQEKTYLLQLQIEDISRKLRTGDMGIPANVEERSPSPEPIYNHEGKRLNTREMRTRRRLEEERHKYIQEMMDINIDYKPPPDYKAPAARYTDKVIIPQDDHPEINFVGLLIGPRGNTLKSLEKETGTKIIIRGKGSVKEGKIGRPNRDPLPGEDEPLHAYITGQAPETVRGAVERIKRILVEGIEVPEHQNDLRKQQLRELALLNGTLRDDMGPRCSNCGSTAHRTWNCPDKPNITHSVICTRCGGAGHIAKDCKADVTQIETSSANMDDEYLSLMAELGQGSGPPRPKPSAPSSTNQSSGTPTSGASSSQSSFNSAPPPPSSNSHSSSHSNNNSNYQSQQHNAPPPPATVVHTWPPTASSQSQHSLSAAGYNMFPFGMPPWGMGMGGMAPPPPPGSMSQTNGMGQSMGGHAPPPPPPGQQQYNGYGAPPYNGYGGMPPPPPPPM